MLPPIFITSSIAITSDGNQCSSAQWFHQFPSVCSCIERLDLKRLYTCCRSLRKAKADLHARQFQSRRHSSLCPWSLSGQATGKGPFWYFTKRTNGSLPYIPRVARQRSLFSSFCLGKVWIVARMPRTMLTACGVKEIFIGSFVNALSSCSTSAMWRCPTTLVGSHSAKPFRMMRRHSWFAAAARRTNF